MTQYTIDSIWSEHIRIKQPKRGYRFAIDALLLAHFLRTSSQDEVLEIGCGVGVIAVLFANLQSFHSIVCVEVQKTLADLAAENLAANQIFNAEVLNMDANELNAREFDLIYSNPPYRKLGAGKLNPTQQKAIARHEIHFKLADMFQCADRLLKPDGRFSVILPDFREADFRKLVNLHKFHWQEIRYVHPFPDKPPQFFLATIGKRAVQFLEYPRLVIYERPGKYSVELNGLLTKS